MEKELEKIVEYLKQLAGEDDMASVQINSSGVAIVRIGPSQSYHISVSEFAHQVESS